MFARIKELFAKHPGADAAAGAAAGSKRFSEKELATAALLVEAATLDGEFDLQEHETIRRALCHQFSLDEARAEALITEAKRLRAETSQLVGFTRTIKDHFDEKERIALIEMLWEVVYADGELHDFEANLMRRIGGLIYVAERERGDARKRVLARLGLDRN